MYKLGYRHHGSARNCAVEWIYFFYAVPISMRSLLATYVKHRVAEDACKSPKETVREMGCLVRRFVCDSTTVNICDPALRETLSKQEICTWQPGYSLCYWEPSTTWSDRLPLKPLPLESNKTCGGRSSLYRYYEYSRTRLAAVQLCHGCEVISFHCQPIIIVVFRKLDEVSDDDGWLSLRYRPNTARHDSS